MEREISWNNRRHPAIYWISVLMLLFVAQNIQWLISLGKSSLFRTIRDLLFKWQESFLPLFSNGTGRVEYVLLTLCTFHLLIIILIWLANHLCGFLPNTQISESPHIYSYLFKTVVIEDIAIGIVLEIYAISGLFNLQKSFRNTSIAIWLYIVIFLCGSYMYWRSTLILRIIYSVSKLFRSDRDYERDTWYCVSNCKERISSFSRAPWSGNINCFFVDANDITLREGIMEEGFFYYLLIINCNAKNTDQFEKKILKIASMPHTNILALVFGESDEYSDLVSNLKKQKNVQINKYPACDHIERMNIECLVNNIDYCNKKTKAHPFRFLNQKILIEEYLKIGVGASLSFDLMTKIMNELGLFPSIYALFDYVDLQYRIKIASILDSSYKGQYDWMRNHWKIIGRINLMANKVENKVIKPTIENYTNVLSTQEIFEKIFSDIDIFIIRKYLPNYEKKYEEPVQNTIVHLTALLRNSLRAHGSFEKKDSLNIYTLVFKLALLNNYILGANDILLSIDNQLVWDNLGGKYYCVSARKMNKESQRLSPFFIADEEDNVLVFNNWNKECGCGLIEYINYLDGKLINLKMMEV